MYIQLDEPTMDNSYNFKFSPTKPQNKVKRIRDYLDYFSLEIHGEFISFFFSLCFLDSDL